MAIFEIHWISSDTIGNSGPHTLHLTIQVPVEKWGQTKEIDMGLSQAAERDLPKWIGWYLGRALVGLTLLSFLGLIPGSAWGLSYIIAPGATFESVSTPSLPLTGQFELTAWGVCANPCEPDAYAITDVVLAGGGQTLSSGVVAHIFAGSVFESPAFEVLPNGSVVTGEFTIERTITSEGTLSGDPHNHDYFQTYSEILFGPLAFITGDPREVIFSTPRGEWPVEVTLAYAVIERTGTALSGYDGSGTLYSNEIVDLQSTAIGQVIFTAHPVPEPSTGLLVLMGLFGFGWRRAR